MDIIKVIGVVTNCRWHCISSKKWLNTFTQHTTPQSRAPKGEHPQLSFSVALEQL